MVACTVFVTVTVRVAGDGRRRSRRRRGHPRPQARRPNGLARSSCNVLSAANSHRVRFSPRRARAEHHEPRPNRATPPGVRAARGNLTLRRGVRPERIHERLRRLRQPLQDAHELAGRLTRASLSPQPSPPRTSPTRSQSPRRPPPQVATQHPGAQWTGSDKRVEVGLANPHTPFPDAHGGRSPASISCAPSAGSASTAQRSQRPSRTLWHI